MFQEAKEMREQTPKIETQATIQESVKKPKTVTELKILSHKEFLLSPYHYGKSSTEENQYYLVVETRNREQDTTDELNNPCMIFMLNPFDSPKKTTMHVSTPKGLLRFNVTTQGNIELLSAPANLNLVVNTPGLVSHKSNDKNSLQFKSLTIHADDIELLGITHIKKGLTLYPRKSRKLADASGGKRSKSRLTASNINIHLPEGETITQPYTAWGSLSYHLSPTATQPLVFLANQTSLQGHFAVESPALVKMGDATHFVTVKTDNGNFFVKASVFDIEQGGVVAVNSLIDVPGGFTLGRLIEDPNRKVFGKVNADGMRANSHLFKLPVAKTNGSFLQSRAFIQILGSSHLQGLVTAHHFTINSLQNSMWEASTVQVTGDCILKGHFILKRSTVTFSAVFNDIVDNTPPTQFQHLLCNSDPTSLTVQGILDGDAIVDVDGSYLYATKTSFSVAVNEKIFVAPCFQEIVTGELEEQRVLNSHKIAWPSGKRGGWMKADPQLPGFSAPTSLFVKRNGFTSTPTVFRADVSYNSPVVLSDVQQMSGMCSAPAIFALVGNGQTAIGSPNPYYIPPKAPIRDLMKEGFNLHTTFVNPDLKAALAKNQSNEPYFNFMVRELYWFNDKHAQAFYREIAHHLFVVSEEGIKQADPRAVLSLSPKLLIERVQKEIQDVLMRGYIEYNEVIDEAMVQRLHHNATEYLSAMNDETLKDFLSGKAVLKSAPIKPLIYYEPVINEQNVEVLQPHLYIPLHLINEVRTQRGGLFRANLFLVFSNKFAPQQLITLTQNNPVTQNKLIEFFAENPDTEAFLEQQAAQNVAADAQLEHKHQAEEHNEHAIITPEHTVAVPDKHSSLTLAGHFATDIFAVLMEGSVSMQAADIKTRDAFIVSLFDDVELKAITERVGNNENFHDIMRRTHIAADGILKILAGKNVVFEAAHTQSVLGTYIEALGNIIDMPVELVSQRVQHFYGRKCSGTIIDIYARQVPSMHQTNANIEMHAGDSTILHAPQVEAQNFTATAVKKALTLPVTESHQCSVSMTQKGRGIFGRTKASQSISMEERAIAGQMNVQDCVTIASGKEACIFMNSTAHENKFWGEVVHFIQGVNRSCSATQTQSRNILWQKLCAETVQQITYTESHIAGSIEIHAQRVILDQVRGKTLGFWQKAQPHNAVVTYQILDPQYQHDRQSIQGPSQGLIIVVSLAVGVATFGAGTAVSESVFVTTTLGIAAETAMSTAIAAGFSTLCAQAAVSLLQNEGNPGKALESLASKDTAKALAISMISAGVMHEIVDRLKLPKLGEQKALLEHAKYNIARASVNMALNMGINQQSFHDAFKAGLIDATVGTAAGAMAQEIGVRYKGGDINSASHILLHAALGAVGGVVLNGSKGAVAGAIGAGVAEMVAEAAAPKEPLSDNPEEHNRYRKQREKAASIANLTAATVALLSNQPVATAVYTATNATTNNFLASGGRLGSSRDPNADDVESKNDEMDESQLAQERTCRSITFKLDGRRDSRVPRNAWERLAEGGVPVTYFSGSQKAGGNTFMPLWSLARGDNGIHAQPAQALARGRKERAAHMLGMSVGVIKSLGELAVDTMKIFSTAEIVAEGLENPFQQDETFFEALHYQQAISQGIAYAIKHPIKTATLVVESWDKQAQLSDLERRAGKHFLSGVTKGGLWADRLLTVTAAFSTLKTGTTIIGTGMKQVGKLAHRNRSAIGSVVEEATVISEPVLLPGWDRFKSGVSSERFKIEPLSNNWIDSAWLEEEFFSKSILLGEYNQQAMPGVLSERAASTFMGTRYQTFKLTDDLIVYRAGSSSKELGSYFSLDKPIGELQTRIDKAIRHVWPNGDTSIIDTGYIFELPKGLVIHFGDIAPQRGLFLGGTKQIYIEKRFLNELELIDKYPLFKGKNVFKHERKP